MSSHKKQPLNSAVGENKVNNLTCPVGMVIIAKTREGTGGSLWQTRYTSWSPCIYVTVLAVRVGFRFGGMRGHGNDLCHILVPSRVSPASSCPLTGVQ